MASQVVSATDSSLQEEIKKSVKPILLDFWATWCTPCKITKPIVEKLAEDMKDKLHVIEVDVDKNPNSANQYNVMSIPTMFVLVGGKVKAQINGAQTEADLKNKIEEAIKLK